MTGVDVAANAQYLRYELARMNEAPVFVAPEAWRQQANALGDALQPLLDALAVAEQQRDDALAVANYERGERERVERELAGARRTWDRAHRQALAERDDALAKIAAVEALCDADDQRRVPGALHVSRVNAEEIRAALTDPHRGSAE